ncbi:hypothetical protein GYB61_12575 [bacterium]|nr:hypothetical protein [bacterium]
MDTKAKTPLSTAEKMALIDPAVKEYKGQFPELERAIGVLFTGELVGWKVLYLIHDKKTIRKYEKALGVNFREIFPAEGKYSHKSIAYEMVKKVSNFWKAAKGEIKGIKSPDFE